MYVSVCIVLYIMSMLSQLVIFKSWLFDFIFE